MNDPPVALQPRVVDLDHARHERPVEQRPGDDARTLLAALDPKLLTPTPVLLVCGGADHLQGPSLDVARSLVVGAVIATARLTGCAVLDGGTASGVMLLTGAARAEDPSAVQVLIGVAPAAKVAYPGARDSAGVQLESNHTHYVLADADEWGGETKLMFAVAETIADGAPVAMLLAGGGSIATAEALEAAKRGWPIFALEDTGGTAAELAAACRARTAPAQPETREILGTGDVRAFKGSEPAQLARLLAWELRDEPVLKDAWRAFAGYDQLAARTRKAFERFQRAILTLGILATLVALLYNATGSAALHWGAVAAPILVSSVIALANRRAAGKHWVLLRAAAESVKGEIYRYRTRAGVYADTKLPDGDPSARPRVLARRLDRIEEGLMHTEASSGSLDPYSGPLPPDMYGACRDDDGISPLDANRYLQLRVGDQLTYFRNRVRQLDRRREWLQAIAVIAGGSGAILAAAGVEVWVGLSTAVSGAALAYLASLQVDNTIITYNQAASKLACLKREWVARPPGADDRGAFEQLVLGGEAVLGTELGGWVQQMTQTVDRLQAQHAPAAQQPEDPHKG